MINHTAQGLLSDVCESTTRLAAAISMAQEQPQLLLVGGRHADPAAWAGGERSGSVNSCLKCWLAHYQIITNDLTLLNIRKRPCQPHPHSRAAAVCRLFAAVPAPPPPPAPPSSNPTTPADRLVARDR